MLIERDKELLNLGRFENLETCMARPSLFPFEGKKDNDDIMTKGDGDEKGAGKESGF